MLLHYATCFIIVIIIIIALRDKLAFRCTPAYQRDRYWSGRFCIPMAVTLKCWSTRERQKEKEIRKRSKEIWFNPPFSRNISANVARSFLILVPKHFPAASKLHKIFNKNSGKVS